MDSYFVPGSTSCSQKQILHKQLVSLVFIFPQSSIIVINLLAWLVGEIHVVLLLPHFVVSAAFISGCTQSLLPGHSKYNTKTQGEANATTWCKRPTFGHLGYCDETSTVMKYNSAEHVQLFKLNCNDSISSTNALYTHTPLYCKLQYSPGSS